MAKTNAEISTLEKQAQTILTELKKSSDLNDFMQKMANFKLATVQLPHMFSNPPENNKAAAARYRKLALKGYETAVKFFSGYEADAADALLVAEDEVKKYLKLVKAFYFDKIIKFEAKEKETRLEILCLEMIMCLTQSHFSEFYCLVERLTPMERENRYVVFVRQVEENLMEGNYSQLQKLTASKPNDKNGYSPLFKKSVAKLGDTVQKEVEACLETAYLRISKKDAMSLLKNDASKKKAPVALLTKWPTVGDEYVFESKTQEFGMKPRIKTETSTDLISDSLTYAKELEKIV